MALLKCSSIRLGVIFMTLLCVATTYETATSALTSTFTRTSHSGVLYSNSTSPKVSSTSLNREPPSLVSRSSVNRLSTPTTTSTTSYRWSLSGSSRDTRFPVSRDQTIVAAQATAQNLTATCATNCTVYIPNAYSVGFTYGGDLSTFISTTTRLNGSTTLRYLLRGNIYPFPPRTNAAGTIVCDFSTPSTQITYPTAEIIPLRDEYVWEGTLSTGGVCSTAGNGTYPYATVPLDPAPQPTVNPALLRDNGSWSGGTGAGLGCIYRLLCADDEVFPGQAALNSALCSPWCALPAFVETIGLIVDRPGPLGSNAGDGAGQRQGGGSASPSPSPSPPSPTPIGEVPTQQQGNSAVPGQQIGSPNAPSPTPAPQPPGTLQQQSPPNQQTLPDQQQQPASSQPNAGTQQPQMPANQPQPSEQRPQQQGQSQPPSAPPSPVLQQLGQLIQNGLDPNFRGVQRSSQSLPGQGSSPPPPGPSPPPQPSAAPQPAPPRPNSSPFPSVAASTGTPRPGGVGETLTLPLPGTATLTSGTRTFALVVTSDSGTAGVRVVLSTSPVAGQAPLSQSENTPITLAAGSGALTSPVRGGATTLPLPGGTTLALTTDARGSTVLVLVTTPVSTRTPMSAGPPGAGGTGTAASGGVTAGVGASGREASGTVTSGSAPLGISPSVATGTVQVATGGGARVSLGAELGVLCIVLWLTRLVVL